MHWPVVAFVIILIAIIVMVAKVRKAYREERADDSRTPDVVHDHVAQPPVPWTDDDEPDQIVEPEVPKVIAVILPKVLIPKVAKLLPKKRKSRAKKK